MFRWDERAAASTVASLVAGAIFVASVGAALLYAGGEASQPVVEAEETAALSSQARSILSLLLGSPGQTGTGDDWLDDPDDPDDGGPETLVRLGLANETDPGTLSFEKFANLRLAPYAADGTDGYVNYEEAAEGLGLDTVGLDFHIRAFPTLKSVRDLMGTGTKDPNLRVTYIGDISRGSTGTALDQDLVVSPLTCAAAPGSNAAYRMNVTVTNRGTTTTQFDGVFDVTFGASDRHVQGANTFLVPPDASADLWIDVPDTGTRSCQAGTYSIDIYDPINNLRTASGALGGTASVAGNVPRDMLLDTDKRTYLPNEPIVLEYDGTGLKNSDKLDLRVYAGTAETGTPVYERLQFAADAPSKRTVCVKAPPATPDCDAATSLVAGEYTAFLWDGAVKVQERILVADPGPAPYTPDGASATEYQPSEAAKWETEFLADLVEQFCPYYFDSSSGTPLPAVPTESAPPYVPRCDFKGASPEQPGDVFPDLKSVMNNGLPDRLLDDDGLPRYDDVSVLVVGSEIDHNAMTSGAAKHAVRDWVLGGGTLIVFGSEEQAVQWLQPIFHSGIQSSSGGISTPDASHPALHIADELSYDAYVNDGRTWKLNAGAQDSFTNVVVQGSEPVMAVSDPGAFGAGTVIITTWMPYDLFGTGAGTGDLESLRFVNNLLMHAYRDLYLDYGPPIPEGTNVVPAVRKTEVRHPDFVDPVTLDIIVYVF